MRSNLSRALLALCTATALMDAYGQSMNFASTTVPLKPPAQHACGFDAHHQVMLLANSTYRSRVEAFDAQSPLMQVGEDRDNGAVKIPVVVHVMDAGNALTAITDDEIRAGIRALNERWRKVAGTAGAGNGVDIQVEFALAVRDPQGNCTTGITRYDMTGNPTYMANGVDGVGLADATLKSLRVWDQFQYYNIWLVSEIDGNNGGNGTQGYAYFAGAHGSSIDGCVMLANNMRDPASTTLAHEMGHAFNVYHTFEGDANGTTCPSSGDCTLNGDFVCDIPPHIRSASNCNTGGTNSCNGGSSNLLFVNNYMDYSSCGNMFTSGQKARITAALTTRGTFLASNGNLSLVPPGAPTMDLRASTSIVCGTGQSVRFTDYSRCIPNTYLGDSDFPGITFAWTVSNGVSTYNSTAQNPTFTLATAGVYNATLSITTSLGTFTRTENGIVVVVTAPGTACTPTSLNPSGNYGLTVYNVAFNTLNSATSPITSTVYSDFTCSRNTVVARGATYQLSVSITSGSANPQVFSAYLDYNNNNVFETGEFLSSGTVTAGSTTVNANVTIPLTAVTGSLLRLRVYGEVGTFEDAERTCSAQMLVADVEDYGVYVTNNLAAVSIAASPGSTITYGTNVTFTPTPTNGGGAPTYQWYRNGNAVATGGTYQSNNLLPGETVRCEMFSNLAGVVSSPATSNTITMTVTGPPQSDFSGSPVRLCSGGTVTFTDASLLSPTSWSWTFPGGSPASSTAQNPTITYNTPGTYSVTLVGSNANGTGTTMTKTGYITVYAAPTSACTVTRQSAPTGSIGITNVSFSTINNTTVYNDAAMNNFTCSRIAVLNVSTLYSISVTVGPVNPQWVRAYIDYNNDGDFADANESIFSPANGTGTLTGNFTVPASLPVYNTLVRMRVITDFLNTAPGSCTTPLEYGQVEEYGVVVPQPPNTAPVLNTAPSVLMSAVLEDAGAPVGAVGTLVSALVDLTPPAGGLDNVTDPDAGALTGVAVVAADATNGTWFYSINNGTNWNALGTVSGSAARLLAADANCRLYFQPAANFNGTIATAITYRAWDRTTGTNGGTADVGANGAGTAFSTATETASLTVTAVNDAPVLNTAAAPALAAVNEDAGAPVGAVGTLITGLVDPSVPAGDLDNISDVDASPLAGIAVVAADVANGSWFFSLDNGTNWSALGTPTGSAARLLPADGAARLYFQPAANFNGAVASAITFRAWDRTSGTGGGTADAGVNGGITAFSAATDVASITVTAVNDAPVLNSAATPVLANVNQDAGAPSGAVGTLVSALVDASVPAGGLDNVSDVDAAALLGIAIVAADAANGTWHYSLDNGASWNPLGAPSAAAARLLNADASARIYFQPNAGFSGTVSSAITFRAWDRTTGSNGATANASVTGGSTAFSASSDVAAITVVPVDVKVALKAMLEGPYNAATGLMGDNLRSLGLLPTTEPYTGLGYSYVGTTGGTTTAPVLAVTGNNAIVDWVAVELRNNATPTTIVASRAALIQRDGDVVALDGASPLSFSVSPGTYRVAIRHRNHLPAMTLNGVSLTSVATTVDLSSAATAAFGTEARKAITGTFPVQGLWAGDVLFDNNVQYVGANNDRDPILTTVGSTTPNNVVTNVYSTRDTNLDGSVIYVGLGNDRDLLLTTVGSTTPNSVRAGQLP